MVSWDKLTLPKKMGGLGFRRARETNTALLGILVWDMQQNNQKLWVEVLHEKYVTHKNFLECTKKLGSSVWSSIFKAKQVLRGGYKMRLGVGDSSFWYDSWSTLSPLCNQVSYVNIQDDNMEVRDVTN